jgi:CheY-like chemotaxis protein
MQNDAKSFGEVAIGLSRSPLGIIALFIVLVYGFASLVTTFGGSLNSSEKAPLVYFLVLFPVLVLFIFAWLVSCHSSKLYGPHEFKDEKIWSETQKMIASASIAAAKAHRPDSDSNEINFAQIAEIVKNALPRGRYVDTTLWRNRLLWVDDRPENNVYERQAFEALGFIFSLALSTKEALEMLEQSKFAAIISDMGRREGPREGYVLLEALRSKGNETPFVIYAGSNLPEHKHEAQQRGAQGSTNDPQELFVLVTRAVIRREKDE